MYRAIALYLLREKVKPDDTEAVSSTCTGAEVTLIYQDGEQAVLLNGENVNGFIPVSYTHLDVYKRQDLRRAFMYLFKPFRQGKNCMPVPSRK